MRSFWLLIAIGSVAWSATDDWHEVLYRVRETVAQQLLKSTNFTCVEIVDRTTFRSAHDAPPGCAYKPRVAERKKVTHDRLRLDVAVSQGKEIFTWHGQTNFYGSSTIDEVVRSGTVSSGEFIGFLANIFVRGGVRFEYTGKAVINGVEGYSFNYRVPLSSSGYHLGTKRGKDLAPFHGSFSVRGSDFQLAALSVIGDQIPENSLICSAVTEMEYQVARISGQNALVPSAFVLKLDDLNHRYTVSRSEYSQCRAYAAESTLRFNVDDSARSGADEGTREIELPAGSVMHIALQTTINDGTAYTGDPVQGVLLNSVRVKDAGIVIPKKSMVYGVITMLEDFDEPERHYLLTIQFERILSGRTKFIFRTSPQMSKLQIATLRGIYGRFLPAEIQDITRDGVFIFRGRHFEIGKRFSDYWITQTLAGASPAAALDGR